MLIMQSFNVRNPSLDLRFHLAFDEHLLPHFQQQSSHFHLQRNAVLEIALRMKHYIQAQNSPNTQGLESSFSPQSSLFDTMSVAAILGK
jgi:hypothetical protein